MSLLIYSKTGKKIFASSRNIKNPKTSVAVVKKIDEASAGSA